MNDRLRKQSTPTYERGIPGAIVPEAIYRLDELKARLGWRDAAFRAAVRAGLTIHRSGKRVFVVGADLIRFITRSKEGDR